MAHSRDKQSKEFLGAGTPSQDPLKYYPQIHDPDRLLRLLGVGLEPARLVHALSHRSFSHDHPGLPNNERLEFLGDAVLELVVTDLLIHRYPQWTEGHMTFVRAKSVNQEALAAAARTKLDLQSFVLLGENERHQGDADKDTILCDTIEALFGAVYEEHGYETAQRIVTALMTDTVTAAANLERTVDWKTKLVVLCQQRGQELPTYRTVSDGNLTHPTYTATVVMADGSEPASASAHAKRKAQEAAARIAYERLSGGDGTEASEATE